jgi:hypothetical protein
VVFPPFVRLGQAICGGRTLGRFYYKLVTRATSYPEWVELRPGTLVDRAFVQEHFTVASYEAFVQAYLRERKLPPKVSQYLKTWEVE